MYGGHKISHIIILSTSNLPLRIFSYMTVDVTLLVLLQARRQANFLGVVWGESSRAGREGAGRGMVGCKEGGEEEGRVKGRG